MRITIRVDASYVIGHGHVMRCLTLAEGLRKHGVQVVFVCREHEGHLCGLIEERGFHTSRLPKMDTQCSATPSHAAWLGASWQEDAEQTRAAIHATSQKPDWLVVDHYGLDHRWEQSLRSCVAKIMVIDDLADRAHDCDLLLDQNLVAEMSTRYAGKVSLSCVLLLGPEYALLHQDYAALHGRLPPREGQIRNILISFGAADSMNLTGKTLMAFLSLNRPDIEAHVVISNGSHHCQTIREQAAGHRNVHVHYGVPTLAPLMAKADLAVGASGVTSWERLCLGLPALVITLAENQRPIAERLAQRGMIEWLGHQGKIDELVIARALGKVLEKGLEAEWSLRCRELVDGQGGNRVCELLIADEKTSLRGRHATLTDEAILLKWANDPLTRQNAFLMDSISPDVHRRWFWSRLRDIDGCRLYIIETVGGLAIGQVRFDSKEDTWEVDYSLAPEFRGRGLGPRLLEIGLANLRASIQLTPVILGKVKSANYPSRRVFEKLGFRSQILGNGVLEYRRVL